MRALADLNRAERWVSPAVAALWRDWQTDLRPCRRVRIPVASIQPNALCWLTFWGEPAKSGTGVTVPTPDTAIMFLYDDLITTIERLHPPGWNICWDLECPENMGQHHFRGTSLGGAAAIGLRAITRGHAVDPSFLLIARVDGERLLPVGGAEGKFDAAIQSKQIRRLGLPPKHGLARISHSPDRSSISRPRRRPRGE